MVCAKHRGVNRSRHALLLALTALAGPVCSALFGMAFMFGAIFFTGTAITSKQLIVEKITPGSPAAVAGLIAGDLITSVDRKSEDVESIVTVQRSNTTGEATTLSLPVSAKVRGTIGWTGKRVTFAAGIVASYPWAYFSTIVSDRNP